MAMTGVLRPGHAQLRVLDMDESVKFYTDVMGLVETGRDASGRVYFKTRAERDHNSIVLRRADRAGLDFSPTRCSTRPHWKSWTASSRPMVW